MMQKAIAIDFDGCLCSNAYPEIGAPHWDVIQKAAQEQQDGAGLILWTCREDKLLDEAIAACARWGLTFDAINESLPSWIEAFGTHPRKVGATEYWDDRAVLMTEAQCPLCTGGHLNTVGFDSAFGDARIYLCGGNSRPPADERFRFCPLCGKRLNGEVL